MSAKILIVDDEPLITGLITQILELDGHQGIAVNEPESGLELAKKEIPDLILLDIGMPGMDGYEFCRKLRQISQCAETPVIFLSGKTAEEDAGRSFEVGAASYIRKPFTNSALREMVHLTLVTAGKA